MSNQVAGEFGSVTVLIDVVLSHGVGLRRGGEPNHSEAPSIIDQSGWEEGDCVCLCLCV